MSQTFFDRRCVALCAALIFAACSDADQPSPDASTDAAGGQDSALKEAGSGWPDILPHVDRPDLCALDRKAVEAELSAIGHCNQPLDCTSMPGICPFGCQIAYNKTEDPSKLKQLISAYKANTACMHCSYGCQPPGGLTCEGGRCKVTKLP
jgi:hypothetical protein